MVFPWSCVEKSASVRPPGLTMTSCVVFSRREYKSGRKERETEGENRVNEGKKKKKDRREGKNDDPRPGKLSRDHTPNLD